MNATTNTTTVAAAAVIALDPIKTCIMLLSFGTVALITTCLLLVSLLKSKQLRKDFYPLAVVLAIMDLANSLACIQFSIFKLYLTLYVSDYSRLTCMFGSVPSYTANLLPS